MKRTLVLVIATIVLGVIAVWLAFFTPKKLNPTKATYVVTVKVNEIDRIQKLSQLIDSVVYIPLETNEHSLIGRISKIVHWKSSFYILDDTANCLFKFDESGVYLAKYDKVGKGPCEYLKISDFNVDASGTCYLLDERQIIRLDPNLNPLSVIDLPFGAMRFCINHDGFVVQTYGLDDELAVLSFSGTQEYSSFAPNGSPRYVPSKPFETTLQRVLFNPCFSNVMYDISNKEPMAYLFVDYECPVPDDFFSKKSGNQTGFPKFQIPDACMSGIDYYSESNDDVFFGFSYNHKGYDGPFYVKYSKKHNEAILFTNRIENDCYQSMYPPNIIAATDDGWFIAIIQSSQFNESFNCGVNNSSKGVNTHQESDLDNPIIALVRFREGVE